ncbi:pyridoxal phosphate-dependent aminotransferase [Desulfogranum japonicum]|uniref:pyridoxal phosphate-dependent aminotransferase n=1 Tax=Desulfogranum japonicum TaxID=231447 RepID=UPI0003FA50CD|nr:aminotransferase class I/II-fold pyridoxal phosphate-dependent enzyme [Desulfogranum japonicum]
MIIGHGGNKVAAASKLGCRPEDIVDMSSNINPLGMVPGLMEHLGQRLEQVMSLPEVDAGEAIASMAHLLDIDPSRMLMGTGTTQFIYTVCPALQPERVLVVGPTYADYSSACTMHQVEQKYFLAGSEDGFRLDCQQLAIQAREYDVVFLCNSNNPTGQCVPHDDLVQLCRSLPDTTFVIDESYLPFAPKQYARSMTASGLENVVVLWSISKIFGIPGLRAGFLVAEQPVLERFRAFMQPWSANSLAQEAAVFLGAHKKETLEFIEQSADFVRLQVDVFQSSLEDLPLQIYPTLTPYMLIGLPENLRAESLCEAMLQERLLIRNCSNFYGLNDQYVRIALKNSDINEKAAQQLRNVMIRYREEG